MARLFFLVFCFFCTSSFAEAIRRYSDENYEFQFPSRFSVQQLKQKDTQGKCVKLINPLLADRFIMRLCFYQTRIRKIYGSEQYSRYDELPVDARKMVGHRPVTGMVIFSGDWFWPTYPIQSKFIKGIDAAVSCGEENSETGRWMTTGSDCYMAIFERKNFPSNGTISVSTVLRSASFGDGIALIEAKKIIATVRFK